MYCCEDYREFIQFVIFVQELVTLYCCEDYQEFIQFVIFVQDPSALYCCGDYREFIQFVIFIQDHPHCTAVRTTVSSSSLPPAQHCAWNRRHRKPQR